MIKKTVIGLVVPDLEQTGGVSAVARFVKNTILDSDRYELKLISLATSTWDSCNTSIMRPASWIRGALVCQGMWEGLPFTHVGAVAGELEFQRYRSRSALAQATQDCDLFQVVCGSPVWAQAVCGLGKPVAVQCATRVRVERRRRDANPRGVSDFLRKVMTHITSNMEDSAVRNVDAIQVENPWMLDYAQRLNLGRKVDVRYAPPGIDADLFHPLPRLQSNNGSYILCVGRLDDPRKNIGLLLEAYALMPESVRNIVRLTLAGASPPPPSFWRHADALGLREQISYVERPSQAELLALYQNALLFALPSDEEGLGLVLLEAMACGIPVVSTRSGGPEDILTHGEDGFLVALDDAFAMAEQMLRLHVDTELNNRIGRAGRTTIERRYAASVSAAAFRDMWDQMRMKVAPPC